MTLLADRPPSIEQIRQLRSISLAMFGDEKEVFNRHGTPNTRGRASDLIRHLDKERGTTVYGTDLNTRATEEEAKPVSTDKTCIKCGEAKPTDAFGTDKRTADGLGKTCLDCRRPKTGSRAKKPSKPQSSVEGETPPAPQPPEEAPIAPSTAAANGDWRDRFRDPRLSELQHLQGVVESATGNRVDFSLEETAQLARQIAEVF